MEIAMKALSFIPVALLLSLAACDGGNVQSTAHLHGPKPPKMRNAYYDPNSAYASERATWAPPVFDRNGTIIKPIDPRSDSGREDYEHAKWATGAQGGDSNAPPGTF